LLNLLSVIDGEPGCELRTIFYALPLGKSRAHAARFSYSLGRTRGIVGMSGGWLGAQKSRMQNDLQRLALISFYRKSALPALLPIMLLRIAKNVASVEY